MSLDENISKYVELQQKKCRAPLKRIEGECKRIRRHELRIAVASDPDLFDLRSGFLAKRYGVSKQYIYDTRFHVRRM